MNASVVVPPTNLGHRETVNLAVKAYLTQLALYKSSIWYDATINIDLGWERLPY